MKWLVLDASASIELLTGTLVGRELERRLPTVSAWTAPEHFAEVAATRRRIELYGALPRARCAQAFSDLAASPIRAAAVVPLLPRAWSLRGHLTIADALYVALAEELDAPLVTTDGRLASAPGLAIEVIRP